MVSPWAQPLGLVAREYFLRIIIEFKFIENEDF